MTPDFLDKAKRVIEDNLPDENFGPELLKIDPFWDPLRDHERFQKIINNPAFQDQK